MKAIGYGRLQATWWQTSQIQERDTGRRHVREPNIKSETWHLYTKKNIYYTTLNIKDIRTLKIQNDKMGITNKEAMITSIVHVNNCSRYTYKIWPASIHSSNNYYWSSLSLLLHFKGLCTGHGCGCTCTFTCMPWPGVAAAWKKGSCLWRITESGIVYDSARFHMVGCFPTICFQWGTAMSCLVDTICTALLAQYENKKASIRCTSSHLRVKRTRSCVRVFSVSVRSSMTFRATKAVFLPHPRNCDVVSHPDRMWKRGSGIHFHEPRLE